MNIENKWVKLEDVEFNNSLMAISCDTRDFHCNCYSENISPVQLTSGYEFTIEKVKEILLNLKEKSGGEGKWRMLSFEKGDSGWDWKYIRVLKTKSGNYGISPRSKNSRFVKKDFFKYNKICDKYLHCH
jgi:hypothetical protein